MRLGLGFCVPILLGFLGFGCHPRLADDNLEPGPWQSVSPSGGLFRNPIVSTGADPWVIYHEGFYYFCQSDGRDSIFVSKARNLLDIGRAPSVKVWQAPPGTEHSRQLWAAELHFLDGLWYIYYAASDGDNDNHRMFVLESESKDPTGPFRFKGKITAPTDRWAIDGTVLDAEHGQRYFVWSGWDADINIQQNLYIAPMMNPWALAPSDPSTFLRLEAEETRVKNARVRRSRQASGGRAVVPIDAAEIFLDVPVELSRSGTYQIDIRYANGSGSPASHILTINGGQQTVRYPSFGWENFQTVQVFAPLVSGTNLLRFAKGEGQVELDAIEIKRPGTDRIVLSMPEHDYERQGGPAYVNEGPQVLQRNGKIHIIYSGSASWSDDYKLIQLTFQGGDILNRDNWEKRGSVFSRTRDVHGPGHASFTRSPDGQEDWIIYHAAKYQGAGWDRDIRAQVFTWDSQDNPRFGQPISLVHELPVPSGTLGH